jgi:threonine dehydratase
VASRVAAAPSFEDVERAAHLLSGVVVETPCLPSPGLSHLTGASVSLKLENLQRTGSFKTRGACIKLESLPPERRAGGVVAVSAGNHAQGVAFHGTRMGIATTIVMPKTTPYAKVRRTEALGARVVLEGATLASAYAHAQALASDERLTMIHPYDDPHVIAGAGTIGIEMFRAQPELQTVVVPVGGGGLIAGIATALRRLAPQVQIVGVRAEQFGPPTLAEGIAVAELGELNAAIVEDLVDEVLFVDEPSLERSVHLLLEDEKTVVEGAGAAPLAALLRYPSRFQGRRCGLVISGGNIDTGLLASVIMRARFQEGRVARVRVQIVDAPGALVSISTLLASHHANVVDVSHHRAFSGVPAKCAELDFTIEVRHPGDVQTILEGLRRETFETTLLTGIGTES